MLFSRCLLLGAIHLRSHPSLSIVFYIAISYLSVVFQRCDPLGVRLEWIEIETAWLGIVSAGGRVLGALVPAGLHEKLGGL